MNIRSIFILIIFAKLLFSSSYQLELNKNMWNLIGINGFHIPAKNVIPVVGWTQLKDTGDLDNNITWDMLDITTVNTTATPDRGDKIYSTLGIYIERDSNKDLTSSIINYQKKTKNRNYSFISMYIASEGYGRKADLRITFQSNYIGEKFYITFNGSTTQSYEGVFSSENTREKPLVMKKTKANANDSISKIIKVIDMNLSDNNLTNISSLDVNDDDLFAGNTGGRQLMELEENLSVYKWEPNTSGIADNGRWNIYISGNPASTNDFDSYEAGQAYWVKIDTNRKDPVGLILGEGDINTTTYTTDGPKVYNGWNLLSFDESYVRYISTGMFIKNADYNGSGLTIRDNFHKSHIIIPTYVTSSDYNVSAFINNTIKTGDMNGSFSWSLRSYPAINDAGENGIVIIGDEKFEVNATVASIATMSVGKQEITVESQSANIPTLADKQTMYESRIDEFIVGLRLNPEFFSNGGLANRKTKLKFNMPTVSSGSFEADLTTSTTYKNVLSKVQEKLTGNGQALLIDHNLSGVYETLLFTGNTKYYLRDGGIVKLYDFNETAPLISTDISLDWIASSMTITSDGSLQDTVDKINAGVNTSGIYAYIVNQNKKRIMLMSSTRKNFLIREKGDTEQFSIVNTENEDNQSVKGAFTDIFYGVDLAKSNLESFEVNELGSGWDITATQLLNRTRTVGLPYDTTVVTKDLKYTPIWAQDYPTDGPMYKLRDVRGSPSKTNYLVSGVTREDSTIYWSQSDMTMSPEKWKTQSERFNLYKVHKKRGYWTYLDSSASVTANPLTVSDPSYLYVIKRNFNNLYNGGTNSISSIENHQSVTTEISISGFTYLIESGQAGEMAENVVFNINGEVIPMLKDGTSFKYIAELNDYQIPELQEKVYPSLKTGMNLIATDGAGNKREKLILFDNVKPAPPEFIFENNNTDSGKGYFGGLRLNIEDNLTLQIFDGNLSDYVSNTSKLIRDPESLVLPSGYSSMYHHINPLATSYITYGTPSKPYYDLRVTTYKSNNLWSNMRRILFAPVYKSTHILENNESDTGIDMLPIAFDSTGQNPAKYTSGDNWVNSGVELNTTDGDLNNDANITLSLSYEPIVGASFDSALADDVYFDDNTSATGYVGRIRYNTQYEGKVFYVYSHDQNKTYWQLFPVGNKTTSDPLELIPIDGNQTFYKPSLP